MALNMEDNIKNQKLLDEFAVPTYEQWLELVEKQLKGASFEKKLVKKMVDGFSKLPIYCNSDSDELKQSIPGKYPFRRGTTTIGHVKAGWGISQHYLSPDASEFNQAVRYDLERGLTAISTRLDLAGANGLDPDEAESGAVGCDGISLFCLEDVAKALENIDLTKVSLVIRPGISFLPLYCFLLNVLNSRNISYTDLKGHLVVDPISLLTTNGGLSVSLEACYNNMAACVEWSSQNTPNFGVIGIDTCPYSESGASNSQELAIALATGVEYLREMLSRGVDVEKTALSIGFHMAVGSDFFLNIAKLRALRILWAKIVSASGGSEQAQKTRLHVSTVRYNKTKHDPHVNLLRATTEAYSAILGGCDSLAVESFDSVFGLPSELSRRVSRNIQVILKEECYGDKVIDPAGGAWYVEALTDQLAEKAWCEFQEIEKLGGTSNALKQGYIQKQILNVTAETKNETAYRKKIIVGTNMYPNLDEPFMPIRMPNFEKIHLNRADEAKLYKSKRDFSNALTGLSGREEKLNLEACLKLTAQGVTLGELNSALVNKENSPISIEPLKMRRVSEDYEELRTKAQDYKDKKGFWPQVFLANMGPLKQHKARADFSTGFLQPGGFSVISPEGFKTVEEAVKATLSSTAKIVVICSTDDTYPDLVPDFAKQIKKERPEITVVVAGYPKDHIDQFREVGVDEFIHLKANNLQLLQQFQDKAGV
ncbi:methylmalonyl-CoA mutase subunit beta [bacterium]|nr:methylmalonyl-CoA mutase subunit beta [bacterium]